MDGTMGRKPIVQTLRHPLFALAAAALFAAAAFMLIHGGLAARAQVDAMADDPVKITDQSLDRAFNRDVAEREIRGALAADDLDLAQSFVALAADRSVQIDPALAVEVNDATVKHDSVSNTAGRFMHGLWTGEPTDLASLAGTVVGDLSVFGDIRDAAREGTRYLTGEKYDPWILGLAGVGIGIGAMTNAMLGFPLVSVLLAALLLSADGVTLMPLIIVGVLRPRIFVSESTVALLSPEELRMALKHEHEHLKSRDNLKRLILTFCPFPGMTRLEKAWSQATELAADDSLAEMRARNRFGIAMAAMIRMIATTISNSISEKPFCFRIYSFLVSV